MSIDNTWYRYISMEKNKNQHTQCSGYPRLGQTNLIFSKHKLRFKVQTLKNLKKPKKTLKSCGLFMNLPLHHNHPLLMKTYSHYRTHANSLQMSGSQS
jgi:hypothetical protein